MIQAKLIETIDVANTLGEGILWRASDQTVWWTDIHACRLYCMSWPHITVRVFEVPEKLCAFAFLDGRDDILLCAFQTGFALYDPECEALTWLDKPKGLRAGVRLNDGRVDAHGRFWNGSLHEDYTDGEREGALYCLDAPGHARAILGGIHISNGLCWTPDGRSMYFADSARGEIYKAPYNNALGVPGRMQPFARPVGGAPDGAVTDQAGHLYSAIWGGERVDVFDANGEKVSEIITPAALQPTCPAFGGVDNNLLFVTSARDGLSEAQTAQYSNSGHVFVFETNMTGTTSHRAQLDIPISI